MPKTYFLAVLIWGTVISSGFAAQSLQDALTQLKSSDVVKRRGAAQDLVDLRNPEAAPALLQSLKDKDPYVRSLSVRGLGYLRWTAARVPLEGVLAGDASTEVRQTAALSLRFLNDPAGIPALIKAVHDRAKPVRLTAIMSLGAFRNASALPVLTESARDADVEIRRQAMYALGQLANPASAALLQGALKDDDAMIRANAAQALGDIPGQIEVDKLEEALKETDPLVQLSAARSLALHGNRSGYDAAVTGTGSSNPAAQVLAIETLGYIGDKSATSILEGLLQSPNSMIKQSADQALKRIREKHS